MEEQLQIEIVLSSQLNIGDSFELKLQDITGAEYIVSETVVERRLGKNQIEFGPGIDLSTQNLRRSLRLDYSNIFEFNDLESGVKLSSNLPGLNIEEVLLSPPTIPIEIGHEVILITSFQVSSVEFLQDQLNACGFIKVRVTTNQPTAQYCINGVCTQVNSTIIEFPHYRGALLIIKLTNYIGTTISKTIQTPPLIDSANDRIRPIITNGAQGGSVHVIYPSTDQLEYEFSLDNMNWQTSNGFYGLPEGSYTLYVRDQYGCKKSIAFNILEENFSEPVVFISKENSLRFMEPDSEFETDENRTFCKSAAKLNYGYIQEFLNTDLITTQFKSNYSEVSASVINVTDNITDLLPVIKLTNNIGVKSKLNQAKKYQLSNSQFGIYFESGQILDYDNNLVLDTYNLNGSLPIWASLGNIIQIDGIFYEIDSIGFDENVNAEVLIFNGPSSTLVQDVIVSCKYNLHDYEVYEFMVDMGLYLNKEIKVEISNQDPNFGQYNWVSERIGVFSELVNYIEIRYRNSTNTNVIYSSEIEHLLRIPFNTIKAVDSDSNESYKTDTNTHLLNSDIYEITDFEFIPLPLELYRKLKMALSMDSVFINGIGYTKNSEFQKENLGSTNLYKLTAQMAKNGNVFNGTSNSTGIVTDVNINLPGLIEFASDSYINI